MRPAKTWTGRIAAPAVSPATAGGRQGRKQGWTSCRSGAGSPTGAAGARCPSRSSPTGWASRRAGSTRSSAASAGWTSSPSLYEIADVLQLDVQLLLGKDPERRTGRAQLHRPGRGRGDPRRAGAVRPDERVLRRRAVPAAAGRDAQGGQPRLAHLPARQVRVLARTLPKLLRDAQAADAALRQRRRRRREAAHLLGQVYQIASSVLRKLGEHELAWLAADRSIAVSQRADDQLLAGIATTRVGNALRRARPAPPGAGGQRQHRQPARARRQRRRPTPDRLSVYGMLLLQGAMAAARIGDSATVDDLLSGAEEAAALLGGDHNHYWTSFGPTNVELHRAAAAVELGDGGRAVEIAPAHRPGRASTRCCPSGGPTTCSTSPAATPRSATSTNAGEMLLRGRPARPVGDPLPADRPRGDVRRAASHPGCAAGADRGAGRAHGSRSMSAVPVR